MKAKRIASLLLCLMMALSLLPTAALAATSTVSSFHMYVDEPVIGEPLQTEGVKAGSSYPKYQVTKVEWSGAVGDNNTALRGVDYTVTVTLDIKKDADAVFSDSVKVYVNSGTSRPATVERVSGAQIKARYTWSGAAIAEKADAAAAREAEKAAADALKIKNLAITIAQPVFGQPLPTTASIAESDVEATVKWTTNDKTGLATTNNTANFTVTIKEGSNREFSSTATKATVNGNTVSVGYRNKSKVEISYNFALNNTTLESGTALSGTPRANPINVTYDTFDYRAYANVYPDVKAAYGYDAQKLWAHYSNYGKAEGRVAYAISASDNPKSGATTYKNAAAGTDYTNWDGPATVSATYLDPLPPSSNNQAQNWHDRQLTRPQFMSNAKLVAEWHSITDVINNKKTGWNFDLVRMTRRSALVGELSRRASDFENIYCYENGIKRINSTTVSDKQYQESKTSEEYARAAQSDCIILLHWMYGWRESSLTKQLFATPPANPGTAGGTAPSTPTTPAAPAKTAYASTQTVELDGKKVEFQMYALEDANGGRTNYIKIRDLAFALNDTNARFSVEWDGQVNLVTRSPYSPNGTENSTPFKGNRAYSEPTSPTKVNGAASDLSAIVLTDDNGGAYTYYQLRDLGQKLGFNVGWSGERGVYIESDKPYSDND